jgi:hypothetical protein
MKPKQQAKLMRIRISSIDRWLVSTRYSDVYGYNLCLHSPLYALLHNKYSKEIIDDLAFQNG